MVWYDPSTGQYNPGQHPLGPDYNWRQDVPGLGDTPLGGGADVWDRDFTGFPLLPPIPPIYEEGGFTGPQPTIPGPGGGGGGGGGGGIPGYRGPTSPQYNFRPAPEFVPPQFAAPSFQDAMNSPGYQFRASEGQRALEQSAAARGVLRTGGHLKDLQAWGQNFAAQEYQNVYDRALSAFDRRYQGARDAFTPRFAEWQTLTSAEQRRGDLEFQRLWDMYTFPLSLQNQRDIAILGYGVN